MTSRRRMMMGTSDIPDLAIPEEWKSLETITDSWHTIIRNCKNGLYKTKYKVGDTKAINFGNTLGIGLFRVAGFDVDETTSGNMAHMSWIADYVPNYQSVWNTLDETDQENGYMTSVLKSNIDALLPTFPNPLRNAICEVRKSCHVSKSKDVEIKVKLWTLSCREIGFTTEAEQIGPVYIDSKNIFPKFAEIPPANRGVRVWTRSCGLSNNTIKSYSSMGEGSRSMGQENVSYYLWLGFCI